MIDSAVRFLNDRLAIRPRIGVVLGSGLGAFAEELSDASAIPYETIPGWPRSTAVGHAGSLFVGICDTVPVAVLSGRCHLYEGYTPAQVTFGVRVLARLGVHSVVLTNAAGGINSAYKQGGLVLISDHINLQGSNPLTGPNDDACGPRFPDMTDAYTSTYRAVAREVAQQLGLDVPEGVYAAVAGPSYETPAEIRYLRAIGADLVGMSTVPEVIVANWMGLGVVAISCVTNMAAGLGPGKLDHAEVLATGERVRGTLVRFLRELLPRIDVAHG